MDMIPNYTELSRLAKQYPEDIPAISFILWAYTWIENNFTDILTIIDHNIGVPRYFIKIYSTISHNHMISLVFENGTVTGEWYAPYLQPDSSNTSAGYWRICDVQRNYFEIEDPALADKVETWLTSVLSNRPTQSKK